MINCVFWVIFKKENMFLNPVDMIWGLVFIRKDLPADLCRCSRNKGLLGPLFVLHRDPCSIDSSGVDGWTWYWFIPRGRGADGRNSFIPTSPRPESPIIHTQVSEDSNNAEQRHFHYQVTELVFNSSASAEYQSSVGKEVVYLRVCCFCTRKQTCSFS